MIGIAAMIGGAIFVLTGPAIGLAGSAVILAFIINAIITLFTAMGYAELGSAMPEAGGGYLWVREGLPRPNAFISGWMAWLAHIIAGSLYSVAFGSFFVSLLNTTNILTIDSILGFIPLDKLIAVISIALFTIVNIRGTSETGKIGTIVTIVQLVAIISIIIAGFWAMTNSPNWQSNFADFMPMGLAGLFSAMGLTFIAFEGYEVIVQSGEEVKNPKRNIPRAIFISLALVVIMYCLVAFVSIGAIFPESGPAWQFIGQNGDLGIMKAAELFMPYGGFIVLVGGLVSTLAALNATTFSSARVAFAMGRHYNLPHKLSEIHPKFKTPYVSVILSSIIMAIMAYALPLESIAQASAVIFLLLFTQVNVAVITIRKMYGDKLDYGFKTPFFPVIPITGMILMIGLALYLLVTAPFSWFITALWVLVGFSIYRIFTFRKEVEHYYPIITSEGNIVRKDFRILIPYTPENPDRLIKYAIRIAKEKDAEIDIIRTITVPHQTPLSAGVAFVDSARKAFEPLEDILNSENIIYHYFVRISHDSTEAVLSTIAEQKINLLIIDYETIRTNKKLQTLITCDFLAILPHGDITIKMERQSLTNETGLTKDNKKNLVVLYDDGDNSDEILKITNWFANTERFNLNVVALSRKGNDTSIGNQQIMNKSKHSNNDKDSLEYIKRKEYFLQAGVEFNEIHIPEDIEKDSLQFAKLILKSIVSYNPDIVITESTLGKYSLLTKSSFANLLMYRLNCPIIIVKDVSFPLVNVVLRVLKQFTGHLSPFYLVKLLRSNMK
ncbi:MAG: amino acid permease [Nitrosopumilus sp.]|nr:amino acid permease [Nitrosopumilus sp.]